MRIVRLPGDAHDDSTSAWWSAARELAKLDPAVTVDMRRKHPQAETGACGGPHGVELVEWPCSTWTLADTADRIRAHRDRHG